MAQYIPSDCNEMLCGQNARDGQKYFNWMRKNKQTFSPIKNPSRLVEKGSLNIFRIWRIFKKNKDAIKNIIGELLWKVIEWLRLRLMAFHLANGGNRYGIEWWP